MKKAKFKRLPDNTYFGEIPSIRGIWADSKTLKSCKKELQEVLEDWLVLSLKKDKKIPGFSLIFDKRSIVKNA